MHHHRVDGSADRCGKAAVALERRDAALRADVLFGRFVELLGADARARLRTEHPQAARLDPAGIDPGIDLLRRLSNDHSAVHIAVPLTFPPLPLAATSQRSPD